MKDTQSRLPFQEWGIVGTSGTTSIRRTIQTSSAGVHAEKCNAMQYVINCRGGDAIQHFWVQLRDRGRLWRSTIGIESGFVYTWSVGQDFLKEMQQLVETCPGNTFSHQN